MDGHRLPVTALLSLAFPKTTASILLRMAILAMALHRVDRRSLPKLLVVHVNSIDIQWRQHWHLMPNRVWPA